MNNYNNLKSQGSLMFHGVNCTYTLQINSRYLVPAVNFWLQEIDSLAFSDVYDTSIR